MDREVKHKTIIIIRHFVGVKHMNTLRNRRKICNEIGKIRSNNTFI